MDSSRLAKFPVYARVSPLHSPSFNPTVVLITITRHMKLVVFLQECYVHNLLRITVYVPALRRDVLELIISKMLTLDVGR